MGEVIRKDAAADDILADTRTTLTRANARGGDWQSTANTRLSPVIGLADSVATRLADARRKSEPAEAALSVANDVSDRLINRVAHDVWNLGSPRARCRARPHLPGGRFGLPRATPSSSPTP